jgi:hypothetical protein
LRRVTWFQTAGSLRRTQPDSQTRKPRTAHPAGATTLTPTPQAAFIVVSRPELFVVCLPMDQETLKRQLADVEKRVAQDVPLVVEQRTLVARLEREGRDTEAARARELLALLEESLRLDIDDRRRLRELREYEGGSSTSHPAMGALGPPEGGGGSQPC